MNNELIIIKAIIAIIGFSILLKPKLLMFIQDHLNKINGLPPMSSRVRPIFVRLMGLVVIIMAITF